MAAKIVFGLLGCGGFGREAMPIARETVKRQFASDKVELFFVETQPTQSIVNGTPVISEAEFIAMSDRERYFNIAVGDSKIRETIAIRWKKVGMKPLSLIAPNVTIYDHNEIGEGAVLCANTVITSNTKIGAFFQSNLYSYVGHDCVIGDYVTFTPSVHCNGNVHIGNHVYVGTGAMFRPGSKAKPTIIGEGAVIGMGAVVTKDVPPHTTVIGNPARPMQKPAP